MNEKKVPMRTCIACRSCKPKKDLIRIVKNESNFVLDYNGKMNGRGTYICNNNECFDKLIKFRLLNKCFKQNIPQSVYDALKENYIDKEN